MTAPLAVNKRNWDHGRIGETEVAVPITYAHHALTSLSEVSEIVAHGKRQFLVIEITAEVMDAIATLGAALEDMEPEAYELDGDEGEPDHRRSLSLGSDGRWHAPPRYR